MILDKGQRREACGETPWIHKSVLLQTGQVIQDWFTHSTARHWELASNYNKIQRQICQK